MTTWAKRAKEHFSQKGQNSTTETTETPLLGVLTVQSGRSYEKHDFSNQAANDPTPSTTVQALPPTDGAVATVRPAGLSPKLLAASLALDALQAGLDRDPSIVASGSPGQEARQEATRPWHHVEASWRELAEAYHHHHFACKTCQAAGQGRGLRCGTGAALWTSYQSQI